MNPGKGLDPLRTRAISGVNRSFSGMKERMNNDLVDRGFGRSGQVVSNSRAMEVARAGQIADTDAQYDGMELDQKNRLMQMMMQFGFANPTTTNTSTLPGNMAGGAVGGAGEMAAFLYALNKGAFGAKTGNG